MRVCMLAYTFYENDNRVRRYAETLARRGDRVDVVALNSGDLSEYELVNGVHVYRIQNRVKDEQGKLTYLRKLLRFLVRSACFLGGKQAARHYDLIHVHSVPDFEVFATIFPKLCGTKIILDIHDIVPEFYASKFKTTNRALFFQLLLLLERLSARFADHVIISNHIWWETLVARSVKRSKCTPILNYPDPAIFYPRPRTRRDDRFVVLYPGTVNWHQGLDIAVRAFALIKDDLTTAEFHIYGGAIKNNPLMDLIQQLRLEDRVFYRRQAGTFTFKRRLRRLVPPAAVERPGSTSLPGRFSVETRRGYEPTRRAGSWSCRSGYDLMSLPH